MIDKKFMTIYTQLVFSILKMKTEFIFDLKNIYTMYIDRLEHKTQNEDKQNNNTKYLVYVHSWLPVQFDLMFMLSF
jgi:hypothetical protein